MASLFETKKTVTRQLPNSMISYESVGAPKYTPTGGIGSIADGYKFLGGTNWEKIQQEQSKAQEPSVDLYAKYRDPKTGEVMSPEEYASFISNRVPSQRGSGDIGQYAGDALSNPNVSAESLTTTARNLNNTRNDIATGATDPYGVASKSGVAYSPRELAAIEKTYAGVYDPALNDVFSRLKSKEDEERRKQDREDKIFATNESIRQWKATTGSKSTSGDGFESTKDRFTTTQLNKGASNANMNINDFVDLDPELANFFINEPKVYDAVEDKDILATKALENMMKEYENGDMSKDELIQAITEIGLTPEVSIYFISQIPDISEEEKDGWIQKILKWLF